MVSKTKEISIGAVPVSDKVSVGAPRYTIISIVPGHRVSVGVPRYTNHTVQYIKCLPDMYTPNIILLYFRF